MLISLNWLADYVALDVDVDDLANRFAMSGLNHEWTEQVGDDKVFDLEVTSNRGDALGHIGVAREASVLLETPLKIPEPKTPRPAKFTSSHKLLSIENQIPEACLRFTARLIRGVKVGPSPKWLADRLAAINVASVNNIVDATNYVMLECGQPLHAFDFAKIRGGKIVIAAGKAGQKFDAIDHRSYDLDPQTITISDAEGPISIAGVMGGANSEIDEKTVDVVIEAALFQPLWIRRTARRLKLHSAASFRFERRIDPLNLDWGSRRCCDLIVQMAGGQVEDFALETVEVKFEPEPVMLRSAQIRRVLGIDVPWRQSLKILESLGCTIEQFGEVGSDNSDEPISATAKLLPPSHRGDLDREIDLIEEIARIWGYDKIDGHAVIPTFISAKRDRDILLERVRDVMVGSGLCEVITPSCVREDLATLMSPWPNSGPLLQTITPMLEGASILRQSLLPSLLSTRLSNQSLHNIPANLFEVASIYGSNIDGSQVRERQVLGLVSSEDFRVVKGMIQMLVSRCCGQTDCQIEGSGQMFSIAGDELGWLGMVPDAVKAKLKLLGPLVACEIDLDVLLKHFQMLPKLISINVNPVIQRDLNFILPEAVQWATLRELIDSVDDPRLKELQYKETYRDPKTDGAEKKRVLMSIILQADNETMTSEQAEAIVTRVIQRVESGADGKLLGAVKAV